MMNCLSRNTTTMNRQEFDEAYNSLIIQQNFLEGAAYYLDRRERYWNTLCKMTFCLTPGARVLDIGGGHFALLTQRLFKARSELADLDSRYRASVDSVGIPFHHLNLVEDDFRFEHPFDLVILGEVIGHVPVPPHLVFSKLAATLAPGGRLVMTTPNLFRLRNVVRMLLAKPLFEHFVMPGRDRPPGHFIEYDLEQMKWQMAFAGLEVEVGEHAQLDLGGATVAARLIRRFLWPALWLRTGLARQPVCRGPQTAASRCGRNRVIRFRSCDRCFNR